MNADFSVLLTDCGKSAPFGVRQVVEARLFSEGLHVLGQPPSDEHMRQYLEAYFGDDLPEEAVGALVGAGNESVNTLRQRLERSYEQVSKTMEPRGPDAVPKAALRALWL